MQHVDRDAKGVEIKTDVDVITDADCITMDDGDLRSGVKKMIDDRIGEVIDGAPEELDTLKEIATELEKNQSGVSTIIKAMNDKLEAKDLEGYARKSSITDVQRRVINHQTSCNRNIDNLRQDMSKGFYNLQGQIGTRIEKAAITDDYNVTTNGIIPSSKALSDGLDHLAHAVSEKISNFKNCIVLTEDAYNKLSDDEKNKLDTLYFLL